MYAFSKRQHLLILKLYAEKFSRKRGFQKKRFLRKSGFQKKVFEEKWIFTKAETGEVACSWKTLAGICLDHKFAVHQKLVIDFFVKFK